MKILAIRGKNLASLNNEFEVDFRREPLRSTGLFAISGPTGSGKSTLLDALCLALYGATPRLARTSSGQKIPDVHSEQVTSSDPRTLLRRGKGEGYAEVDFLGIDDIAYRARWSIRRARTKNDGKLQNVEYLLTRVEDNQPICGTLKNEVHGEILRLIGLDFNQFTRSVLLAQNDFTTFLKADDNERSELLQTLTGTERFEHLSKRVRERAASERHLLQELERKRTDDPPLDDEARAQLEQTLSAARNVTAILEKQKITFEINQRWHQEKLRLESATLEAHAVLVQAQQTQQAAGERRIFLARVDAVAAARPLQSECERLEREIERALKQLQNSENQLVSAQSAQETVEVARLKAQQQLEAAYAAQKQAQPEIEAAKQLDTEIITLTPQYQATQAALTDAITTRDRYHAEHVRLVAKQSQNQRALEKTATWLTEHATLEPLASHWTHWEYLFIQAEKHHHVRRTATNTLERLRKTENSVRISEMEQTKILEQRVAERKAAEAMVDTATMHCATFNPDAIAQQKGTAETLRDHLAMAHACWSQWQERLQEYVRVECEAKALRQAQQASIVALQVLGQRRPELEGQMKQAELSLQRAFTVCNQDVTELRTGLVEGESCPVCGALEHPYAEHGATLRLHEFLKEQQATCAVLRLDLNAILKEEASLSATRKAQNQQLAAIELRLEALGNYRDAASMRWSEMSKDPILVNTQLIADEDTLDEWFTSRRATQDLVVQNLLKQEGASRAAQKALDIARTRLATIQQAEQLARESHQKVHEEFNQVLQALALEQNQFSQATTSLNEILTQLDEILSPINGAGDQWRLKWQANPPGYREFHMQQVTTWWVRYNEKATQIQTLDSIASQVNTVTGLLAKAYEIVTQAQATHDRLEKQIQEKRQARQQKLSGVAVATVEKDLAQTIHQALSILSVQELEITQVRTLTTQAVTTRDLARTALVELQVKMRQAIEARAAWLARFNAENENSLDIAGLGHCLALDSDWITHERAILAGIDKEAETSATVLKERQARSAIHLAKAKTDNIDTTIDITSIGQQLEELSPLLEQENAKLIEKEVALRQDNERRTRIATIDKALQAQGEKTVIWNKLDDMMGSADGSKFRRIAQQRTLDVLLGYTNRHLADLSRRYRLKRLPDSLALLVIDQDMGDEYRSVHSLSSGESFLVSLALALGLSSLSAHNVRLESLFIDEGLGSLDADTLAIAMDVLDNLQSQGRKVGVISHVHDISERISVKIQIKPQPGGQSRVVVVG